MTQKQWKTPPEMQIDPKKVYRVNLETSKGMIELELYPEFAPKTVNNFVFLAREGFNLLLRIIPRNYLHGYLMRRSYGNTKRNTD